MVVNILLFTHVRYILRAYTDDIKCRAKDEITVPTPAAYVLPLGPSECPASLPASLEAAALDCSSPSGSLLLWRAALSDS